MKTPFIPKLILLFILFFLYSAGYAQQRDSVTIRGQVTDYNGQPIDSCSIFWQSPSFDDIKQAITDKNGYYTTRIPKGKYQSMGAINMSTYPHTVKPGLAEKDQRLEFWEWNFIADRDTTLNIRYHRMEVYGLRIFHIPGGMPTYQIYVRPMSLTRTLQWQNKDFTHAPEDKHVIGNGLPKWYAGWNNTLRYKNFDLNVTMRGAFGFQIINGGRMNYENVKNSRFENRLKSVNDLVFGKHTLSPEVEPEFNSYYVEDGDYWKIDNITLGYSFGQVGKYIKSLRIYGSVLNALTITGYKGIDPEVSTDGLTPGYDTRDRYPSVRSFTFGVNVKF